MAPQKRARSASPAAASSRSGSSSSKSTTSTALKAAAAKKFPAAAVIAPAAAAAAAASTLTEQHAAANPALKKAAASPTSKKSEEAHVAKGIIDAGKAERDGVFAENPVTLADLQAQATELRELKLKLQSMELEFQAMKCAAAGDPCPAAFSVNAFRRLQSLHDLEGPVKTQERIDKAQDDIRKAQDDIRKAQDDIRKAQERVDQRAQQVPQGLLTRGLHHLPSYKDVVQPTKGSALLSFDLVKLPPGAHWVVGGEGSADLVIRKPHYDRLWERVQEEFEQGKCDSGLLLSGNPGIGKTWSLEYLLLRSLTDTPDRPVFVVSKTRYALYIGQEVICCARNDVGDIAMLSTIEHLNLKDKDMLMLHDIKQELGLSYNVMIANLLKEMCRSLTCVLAASPQPGNYKDFVKDFIPTYFYMPMWSWEETRDYLAVFEKKTSEEALKAYEKAGGVPRSLRAYLKNPADFLRKQRCVVEQVRVNLLTAWNGELTSESSKVVGLIPIPDYADYRMSFVSQSALEVFRETHVTREYKMLRKLDKEATRDVLGRFFEKIALDHLKTKRSLSLRKLLPKGAPEAAVPWPGTGNKVEEILVEEQQFSSTSMVPGTKRAADGATLYVPVKCNFHAADCLFEYDGGIWVVQVTVSPSKKPTKAHEDLLATLKRRKWNVKGIVWVVNVGKPTSEGPVLINKRLSMPQGVVSTHFDQTPQYVCEIDYWNRGGAQA